MMSLVLFLNEREGLFQIHKDQLPSISDDVEISIVKQPEAEGEYDLSTIGGIGLNPMFPSKTVIGDVIRNTTVSDRLLFEGAFRKYETITDENVGIDPIDIHEDDKDSIARRFNDFELQIYWNSGYTTNVLTDEKNKKYLYGAIADLTLSFDTSI